MLSYPYSAIKHDVSFRTKGVPRGENGKVALTALKVGSKLPSSESIGNCPLLI